MANNGNKNNNYFDYREYNIKFDNNEYNLRLEANEKDIYFILSNLNESLEYIYKKRMDLLTLINKLEINSSKFSSSEIILKIFDYKIKKNKIIINAVDDNSYNILIKSLNIFEEEITTKIQLIKEFMNDNDKFKYIFNILKLMKNNYKIGEIEKKNKLSELNSNINKRNKEIEDELKDKDTIIQELNKKIINQENIIKNINQNNDIIIKKYEELENNLKEKINNLQNNLINDIKNKNDMINKMMNDKIEIMNKKYNELFELDNNKKIKNEEFDNNLLNKENEINNNKKKDLINNKINENEQNINKKENKLNEDINIINKKINEINKKNEEREIIIKEINNKIEKIKEKINYNEYINKITYKFKKEPQNLKFKFDITNANTLSGWNDRFEVFLCYKDNKEYIISPNCNNYNLDIFNLLDNKKILSLKGHENNIRTIRYFINKNNYNINEYLISGDDNKIIIIWNITNNYDIKYLIDTKYGDNIYSCLLIFPHNYNDNYIITSTYNKSDDNNKSATKIYSLNNGKFIKYINNTNNNHIYYLLSWNNKKNNQYYIIQFTKKKIMINNLLDNELYSELIQEPENDHFSGYIYNRNNNDYLCSSSYNGYINIWDLNNKKISKIINTNNCRLAHIIEWNNKYIIVADVNNKSFKIIDFDENKIISDIGGQHTGEVKCIKKIYHPFYGESLLTCGQDKSIKLWTI